VARLRACLRLGRDDGGLTLVELLVSMAIFALCMSVVFGAVIVVVRKSSDVQHSADASSQLRLAIAQIDRQVRSGNVLFSPALEATPSSCTGNSATNSGTCMRIFTQSNGDEKCVQWQITGDPADPTSKLLRTRSWASDWQLSGNLTPWSTVARGLRLSSLDPFMLQGALTPYKERLLDVRLEAYDSRRKTTIVEQSSMSGRNTSYGYTSSQCDPVPPTS
jgi:prepilin-type N-terminal cleavage/methylation domain-containing protein